MGKLYPAKVPDDRRPRQKNCVVAQCRGGTLTGELNRGEQNFRDRPREVWDVEAECENLAQAGRPSAL